MRSIVSRYAAGCGIAALAVATLVWAAPGGAEAAARPSGSNLRNAGVPSARQATVRQGAAVSDLAFEPSFKCEKPGHSHSVTVHVKLPKPKVSLTPSKKDGKTVKWRFTIRAVPQFTVKLSFDGNVSCTASAAASVPIGESGLKLEVGPELTFTASGEVGADFTWSPTVSFGFTLKPTGFSDESATFINSSGLGFSGDGTASLHFGVSATIEDDTGSVGVSADAGPTITANVSADTTTGTACWSASAAADVDFEAFVHVLTWLDASWTKQLQIGKSRKLGGACVGPDIFFDGSPGTGAPPATLGPYTMQTFAADPTAEGTSETQVTGPTGPITFDSALVHDLVGSDWATWSNGYAGDVYADETALPDGDFEITVTLPPGTGAFYAYAEPNEFEDFAMSATAQDGTTSGPMTVYGDAGAQYFGFYATCGHTVDSVTFTDSGGDTAMAIGEFGIAPTC